MTSLMNMVSLLSLFIFTFLCVSLILSIAGIRTSLYGVHIFHTKYDRVKEYVSQFSEWVPYEHRVVAKTKDIEVKNIL